MHIFQYVKFQKYQLYKLKFYYYTKEDAKLVEKGIASGCGTDAPGSYIAWLCQQATVHAMEMPGKRFDVGNLESYNKIKEEYKGITVC